MSDDVPRDRGRKHEADRRPGRPHPPDRRRARREPSAASDPQGRPEGAPPPDLAQLRRDPEAGPERWLLGLVPAMLEPIASAEWCGSAELLARFLAATTGPLPPCLGSAAALLAGLRRSLPALRARGYDVRFEAAGRVEVVLIDGAPAATLP